MRRSWKQRFLPELNADRRPFHSLEHTQTRLETPALVLNDCTKIRMFSVWSASKRLIIRLPLPEDACQLNMFLSLLDLYELETLPLRKNMSLRSIGVRLRRWRDLIEAGRLLWKHVLLGRPFYNRRFVSASSPGDGESCRKLEWSETAL